MRRDEWGKEPAGKAEADAEHAAGMEGGTAGRSSKLLAATVQAKQRWQASLEQLAKSPDQLRSLRSEQEQFLEELRERRAQELARAEQERLSAMNRALQVQLYQGMVGVAVGSLGLANSKTLAGAALRFLELENAQALPSWEAGVRLLSLLIYLAPAGACIFGATARRKLKVSVAVLMAGNCLVFGNWLTRQRGSGMANACGAAGAVMTALLLLWLWRKECAIGEFASGQKSPPTDSAQRGPSLSWRR